MMARAEEFLPSHQHKAMYRVTDANLLRLGHDCRDAAVQAIYMQQTGSCQQQ